MSPEPKHLETPFLRPIAQHSRIAFGTVLARWQSENCPLILDACCGVGDSTRYLARQNPECLVVGVDKSAHRLDRERHNKDPANMLLVRADLNDFYRLTHEAEMKPVQHFILYPNPWPKAAHLMRRWHGAPVFPHIIALGGRLELRSNWRLYLQEFAAAIQLVGHDGMLSAFTPDTPITPFEAKYASSGQQLWRLTAIL